METSQVIAVDSETTGLDWRHGSKPYFVTTCDEEGKQQSWCWDVNPITRQSSIPPRDIASIRSYLSLYPSSENASEVVLHNSKFDVAALNTIGITRWPWKRTHDTLIASHLLASSRPHDLTRLAIHYLGIDIRKYENAIEQAVKECRRWCRTNRPEWRIARAGLADMPSIRGKVWGVDMWLPREVAKERKEASDHVYWRVLEEYANVDSFITINLWKVMREEIRRRGLEAIYRERMKVIPIAYDMERRGVTLSRKRLESLEVEYKEESKRAGRICKNIAASYSVPCPSCQDKTVQDERKAQNLTNPSICETCNGEKRVAYDLKLPKSGNNQSLLNFAFGVLDLPRMRNKKAKTSNPSLSRGVMEHYLAVLPERSKALTWVRRLLDKRSRDTACAYMEGYKRFWLPLEGVGEFYDSEGLDTQEWYKIFPSINPTGAGTLRWSSRNPNEQNISKRQDFNLRYAFGPAPGREWWSLDFENIELRIPGYESGEESMIDLFERPDDPPFFGSYHLLNASIIYPDLFWPLAESKGAFKKKYSATWYQWCKNAGFSLIYGCQRAKFDATAKKRGAYETLKSKLTRLFALNEYWVQYARKYGYVETLPDRTVDPNKGYPVMCSRTDHGEISPTVPLNYHVQSTAMWCTAKAMVKCDRYLEELTRQDKRGYYLIMQVHDELVFDFPKGGRDNLLKIQNLQKLMESSGEDINIPLRVAITYNPVTWSEGVDL